MAPSHHILQKADRTSELLDLHTKSEHTYALKEIIAYRLQRICSTAVEKKKHSKALENALVSKGYQWDSERKEIEKAVKKDNENLNRLTKESKQVLPITIPYNRTFPNMKSINTVKLVTLARVTYVTTFPKWPIIAYHKNTNLKKIIGGNIIEHTKNAKIKQDKFS